MNNRNTTVMRKHWYWKHRMGSSKWSHKQCYFYLADRHHKICMALHMLELNYSPLFPSVSVRDSLQMTHWVIQLHKTQLSNARFPAGISIIAQRRLAQLQALYPRSVKSYRNGDRARAHPDCNNTELSLLLCSLTPDLC